MCYYEYSWKPPKYFLPVYSSKCWKITQEQSDKSVNVAGTHATALPLLLWLITTKLMLPAMINLQLRCKVNELSKLELALTIS